ncbi:MAG: acetyl-CoA carboxylase, biotin carboxyl carrier protein [Epulopiscium sp. Nuni2H_MBin003]|nr:MAG: acetyl-CoA carboxylase, biotin carboxyl carrier protein [Epulopiscium sp. Nuni2H_MBin003]
MKIEEIKEIIQEFNSSDIDSLTIKSGEFEIDMKKTTNSPYVTETPHIIQEVPQQKLDYIKSPMVGTFYIASSPETKPFVNVGDKVSKGKVVCIIEAMKLMNEVEADKDGIITKILVQDGQIVEFDQPMFEIS